MPPDEVYCENCNWKGGHNELVTFPNSNITLCPECGEPDSITECDAVDFQEEYREQERLKES